VAAVAAPIRKSPALVPSPRPEATPVSPAAPVRPAAADPPHSRSTLMAAGVALVAVLGAGGIVAGYLIQRDDPQSASVGSGSTSSHRAAAPARTAVLVSFSPAGCSGPAPASAARLPQKDAARGVSGWDLLPAWSYFTDGSGLHMPAPDGWTYQRIGTMYCFRDPSGDRVLSLDTGRNPAGDPVKACRTEATRLVEAGALPGYREIGIEPRPLLNKAADWEYTYQDSDRTVLHARTRWFASGGRGFAISWSTREIDWPADLAKINMVLSTFYVDQSNP
jgi:hypothetical protein